MSLKDIFSTIGSPIDAMKAKYLGSIIRAGLIAVGAVTARDVDDGQIAQLSGALIAIASVVWSMYEKYQTRAVLVTSLAKAHSTENEIKALVADPRIQTPDVASHPDAVPCPVVPKPA